MANTGSKSSAQIALDYISESEDRFIRIYDKDTEPMVERWVYPHSHKTDQELANLYSYLNYKNPHVCDVIVPSGIRIKGWAAPNSARIYTYEIEAKPGILFTNDRPLPKPEPTKPTEPAKSGLRQIMEYKTNQDGKFVRLYDKEFFQMEGSWLFKPSDVTGKTPEQLMEFFALPFLPKYVCEAAVPMNTTVIAFASPRSSEPNVYKVESGIVFSNERPILLN